MVDDIETPTYSLTERDVLVANQQAQIITLESKLEKLQSIQQLYQTKNIALNQTIKQNEVYQELVVTLKHELLDSDSKNETLSQRLLETDNELTKSSMQSAIAYDRLHNLYKLDQRSFANKLSLLKEEQKCSVEVLKCKSVSEYEEMEQTLNIVQIKYELLSDQYSITKDLLCKYQKRIGFQQNSKHKNKNKNTNANIANMQYEEIIAEMIENLDSFLSEREAMIHAFKSELNEKLALIERMNDENNEIRKLYSTLKEYVIELEAKISSNIILNEKLNMIIEQSEETLNKQQIHFENILSKKERIIGRIQLQMENISCHANTDKNVNEKLLNENKILKEQIQQLKYDKNMIKQEIQHKQQNIETKEDYIQALKEQIEECHQTIQKLRDQNTDIQTHTRLDKSQAGANLSALQSDYKVLQQKYEQIEGNCSRLIDKLKQKKSNALILKKKNVELKQQLQQLMNDMTQIRNERNSEFDKYQTNAQQFSMEEKERKRMIKKLNSQQSKWSNKEVQYKNEISNLQQRIQNQQSLIDHLEIDTTNKNQVILQSESGIHNALGYLENSREECLEMERECASEVGSNRSRNRHQRQRNDDSNSNSNSNSNRNIDMSQVTHNSFAIDFSQANDQKSNDMNGNLQTTIFEEDAEAEPEQPQRRRQQKKPRRQMRKKNTGLKVVVTDSDLDSDLDSDGARNQDVIGLKRKKLTVSAFEPAKKRPKKMRSKRIHAAVDAVVDDVSRHEDNEDIDLEFAAQQSSFSPTPFQPQKVVQRRPRKKKFKRNGPPKVKPVTQI